MTAHPRAATESRVTCPHCDTPLIVAKTHEDGATAKCGNCRLLVTVRRDPDRLEPAKQEAK
ncbi:hypothetical protein [Deinococcus yavapaiensis]|uniref:Uncharacterized protein n=1 Tax=Deinococcus yavapaiensis KR-236 TaxID=694435 RepID=A0A318S3U7_9DEIO|nr:hypothetical protein [Deinococcus yavapaiensis]PYE51039.1 hypothetical protein DES52_116106 [Deinococcus yavapaiensis KR-236]